MTLRPWLVLLPAAGVLAGVTAIVTAIRARSEPTPLPAPPRTIAVAAGIAMIGDAGTPVSGFEIDALEVSVGQYEACVRAGACAMYASSFDVNDDVEARHVDSSGCRGGRPDRANEPMNCVDWFAANAYCKWAGKRLPSYEEWWLAIGSKHPGQAGELHRPTMTIHEMAGEWTTSPAQAAGGGPWDELRKIGAWRTGVADPKHNLKILNTWRALSTRSSDVGFRCGR